MRLLIALYLVYVCYSLKDIPEYARHGKAAQKLGLSVRSSSNALTWTARVDNFDNNSTDTFLQRYYVDATYWDGNGPVFFEIGGEGTLSGPPGGYIAYLAQNYSALLVALEHRFYGESIPNNNVETENLKHLTVEQALADLNSFTTWFKSSYSGLKSTTPWFVFGGSYPGALASWYRIAYPDASVGSLSSSGVTNCIINFYQFDQQVSAAIGNQCADQIKRIEKAFENKIFTSGAKRDTPVYSNIKDGSINVKGWMESLNLFYCEKDMWIEDFFYMMADSWSMADQYSSKDDLCTSIMSVGETATDEELMQVFADFTNSFWGQDFCSGGFYNTEALSDPERWETNARSWRYQTCSQVSYFNTAPQSGSLRNTNVDLKYHLKQCARMFGEIFPTSIDMNKRYGGDMPTASKVFYSDFSDDPWQRASVYYPVSSDQPYYLAQCDDCGHCRDFSTPQDSDPESLKGLRTEFEYYLAKWLSV